MYHVYLNDRLLTTCNATARDAANWIELNLSDAYYGEWLSIGPNMVHLTKHGQVYSFERAEVI